MECKIWIASYFVSPPPYPTEIPKEEIERHSHLWQTEETVWRCIGTVDSLEAARYMVQNNKGSYVDSEGIEYHLECEPSDEWFYSFAKIEYADTVEYYDRYVPGKETEYGRRLVTG